MDFSTATSTPIRVTIDNQPYTIPRFTLAQFKEWAAMLAKDQYDKALEQYKEPDQRARFAAFWSEPALDVAAIAEELRSPCGVIHVLRTCLGAAGVPAEKIEALIDNGNPMQLRTLTGQLAGVDRAIAQLQEQSGDGGKTSNPTPAARQAAVAAQSTGGSTPSDSPPPSDPSTKTE